MIDLERWYDDPRWRTLLDRLTARSQRVAPVLRACCTTKPVVPMMNGCRLAGVGREQFWRLWQETPAGGAAVSPKLVRDSYLVWALLQQRDEWRTAVDAGVEIGMHERTLERLAVRTTGRTLTALRHQPARDDMETLCVTRAGAGRRRAGARAHGVV